MSDMRKLAIAASIGLWASTHSGFIYNSTSTIKREEWQGSGKRKKPKIK